MNIVKNPNYNDNFLENNLKKTTREIPLKIMPMWWLEEVGGNMTVVEYRSDIFIIDVGMLFWADGILGVDYIIPDVSYLANKKKKIKGIVITHGHLDHIWALKHILPLLDFPPIYGTPLSMALIRKSLEEKKILKQATLNVIDPDIDLVKMGVFTIEFFRVNHSIPDAVWLNIHTPKGNILHTWDFKIDFTPAVDKPADLAKIARIWQEGVLLMFSDSTNATRVWRTPSESVIWEALDKEIKETKWRLIIATFASLIWRIAQIVESAVRNNKIVFLWGRSMINNMEIAKQLWYINVPQGMVRPLRGSIEDLPDHKVVVITTGSQWEEFSALVRIANNEYPYLTIRPADKILLSSSPIPGNERSVVDMTNQLINKWANVVTNNELDIHTSGHGRQDDLKLMLSLVKPKFFVPVHGEVFMKDAHKRLAVEIGIKEENIFMVPNGWIINVTRNKVSLDKEKIKLDTVMIDGLGVGHLSGEYVIKARQIMAQSGMLGFILKIDTNTKELIWNIQIESRGFVYSSEVKKIHTIIVNFVRKEYEKMYKRQREKINIKEALKSIKGKLEDFINGQIGRIPMIIPSFVYITREVTKKDLPVEEAIIGMTLEEQGIKDNKIYKTNKARKKNK